MIEFLDAPDHVLALRARGTLTGEDYDRIVERVDASLAAHPRVGVLADMTGFTDISGEALLKDLKYNLKRIGDWGRFPRCALVTDKAWLKAMAAIWSPLIPGVEMRAYEPGDEAAAMAWVAGVAPA